MVRLTPHPKGPVNGQPVNATVITSGGRLLATRDLATHQHAGALFGLAIGTNDASFLVLNAYHRVAERLIEPAGQRVTTFGSVQGLR